MSGVVVPGSNVQSGLACCICGVQTAPSQLSFYIPVLCVRDLTGSAPVALRRPLGQLKQPGREGKPSRKAPPLVGTVRYW